MSSIKERIKIEYERNDIQSARVVHLYQEGNFYRAYEWSAWLCATRINNFKVSNRKFNGIDGTVAIIGFPPTSLNKFTPEGAELVSVTDTSLDMILPPSVIPNDYDVNLMLQDFEEWKSGLPVAVDKTNKKHEQSIPQIPMSSLHLTDIMRNILLFDVNNHTPRECVTFISDVQKQLLTFI